MLTLGGCTCSRLISGDFCFDPKTDASAAAQECCHVIPLPAGSSSTEHPPGRHCAISGSKEIYRENSAWNLSHILCFGPKSWPSLEFGCCEPFGMPKGDAERGVMGLSSGRCCHAGARHCGAHLGLIFSSLSLVWCLVQEAILGCASPWDGPGRIGPRELGWMEACKHVLVDTCMVSSPL